MTHWRSSWENPRSVWIDGSATFTTAMSRTTMNWTVQRRARANHLRRVAVISELSFVLEARGCEITASTFLLQVKTFLPQAEALCSAFMARRFDQYCPIANALSIVGERWALLI